MKYNEDDNKIGIVGLQRWIIKTIYNYVTMC